MFKKYYGNCKSCPPNVTRLIVVKSGLCAQHNEEKKNIGKPPKIRKPKVIKKKSLRYGQCKMCMPNTTGVLETKHLCRLHNFEKKQQEKSNRIVKLISKSEKKTSTKHLKKELDRVFSLWVRNLGAKDGMNQCFTCKKTLPIKELQCGHYESRKHTSLRWERANCEIQCERCNITLKGNYTVFAQRMIEKYGKEHLEMLAIKKHNRVKWTAFEYKLLIKEYTDKLKALQANG